MAELNQIVEQLSTLSVLEAAELVKLLEAKWGVSAAAPMAMAAMPGAGAAAAGVIAAVVSTAGSSFFAHAATSRTVDVASAMRVMRCMKSLAKA